MKPKYIQLPPLPKDTPLEYLEMMWLYARLTKEEQKILLDFINDNLKMDNKNIENTEHYNIMSDSDTKTDPDITEFYNLMRQMIGILIAQACKMAVLAYQSYCIEKKSVEEIFREFQIDEEFIRLIIQYYDRKTE